MIRVFHPGSGSRIWILTFYLSQIPILDPRSRIQGSKKHRILDPDSQHCRFWVCSGCRGQHRLLTFNGRCCLNNSFNGSALRSFYVQKRILRIFYFHIISLIFTVFKLWCPAHLFPNTPRTVTGPVRTNPWASYYFSYLLYCTRIFFEIYYIWSMHETPISYPHGRVPALVPPPAILYNCLPARLVENPQKIPFWQKLIKQRYSKTDRESQTMLLLCL